MSALNAPTVFEPTSTLAIGEEQGPAIPDTEHVSGDEN
jgi:hypothetical protein